MPLPEILVMDRAAKGGAEAEVLLSVFQGEVIVSEESELVYSEFQEPGDFSGCDELGRFVRWKGKGHV